ncbi:MAG: DUF4301 family protein [Bacteroidales bacterium]|nr:DUF4301 family protein [Bacteroidales bacterium]
MLNPKDIKFLNQFGIEKKTIQEQIELLKKNDSFLRISAPATPGEGIITIDKPEKYVDIFNEKSNKFRICKFVPASGAATRMFKRLISMHQEPSLKNLNDGGFYSVKSSFEQINNFAFFNSLKSHASNFENLEDVAEKILYSGLGYSGIPKGLIEFHQYNNESRTAFEEHLHESIEMSKGENKIDIHLTVSPEHEEAFIKNLTEIKAKTSFDINVSFSSQEKSTDTVALYEDETLVRDNDGNLMLRPGGHGALLQNLNKIDADLIFVKNIDNITHGDYLKETIKYKKMLGGFLIEIIDNLSEIYTNVSATESDEVINENAKYLKQELGADFSKSTNLKEDVIRFINRPVRVCGMVQNTGEPGGGPFWVRNSDCTNSLQIVEKAQINLDLPDQQEYFNGATHFNPVDLVCYLKNPAGEKFDLNKFVDKNACFVSEKTYHGRNIRVLEHPGLWNGAMADWLTVFVEVPLITFNPVKELNDLLRPMHQPKK